ncbi:GDSL-type esterase/lipase family protein [Paraflavitalea sp. CAU 1676]|uniref:GDSL-type esterase/lipase family protein n=1 Tax=Paraflavitalea sp. CAU 1676 TaxID=3032598 RepID=UPI0023DA37E9|nr:GDSL-type esterase/lipase family protein [Paraflavitalea sp. CAU 1676]MDF2189330.1 GDSL-type esterase/lipase family protein [Paraflavitalea sp. CAU 1676]
MKRLTYLSLALNAAFILFFAGKRIYYSSTGQPKESNQSFASKWNSGRVDAFKSSKIDTTDIVFVGTSITEGFLVSEVFGPKVKNRGITLNTSAHLVDRIDFIATSRPKKIVIECGINDIQGDISTDSIIANYSKIITRIKAQSPGTQIVVNSVFPTCGDYFMLESRVVELNKALAELVTKESVQFVDVHSALLKGQYLDSTFTYDGLHLNGAGYLVWEHEISRFIN